MNLPSLSPTADTVIYIYYGNAAAADQQNKTAVWDSNYKGVWHLSNGTTLSAADSTSNANNGTITGATAGVGEIDGAGAFSGSSQYVCIADAASLRITGAMTIEAWVKPTNYTNFNGILSKTLSNKAAPWDYYLYQTTGIPRFYRGNGTSVAFLDATSAPPTGAWSHIAVTTAGGSGTAVTHYLNGAANGSGTVTVSIADGVRAAKISSRDDLGTMFTGSIDEVRVSSVARSADWITTGYRNQSSPGTFYTLGASQGPDLTISKSHSANFTQGQVGATYTLLATNIGASPTSGSVTVTDTVPAGLTATAMSGTGWTCTLPSCSRSDALAAGSSYPPITVTVSVAANAPASVTNTASISGGGETNTANNTASDPTIINSGGGSLPSGWADQDIGQVATVGSATYSNGTYTVRGTGSLYGYADKLHYAYTTRTGDFTVIARVASLSSSATQSLAGVMIRGSLSVDGKYALVGKRADNNITAMMWRADNGDTYGASGNTWAGIPQWVKLVRVGNVFTGYGSTDGQTYNQVGSVTLTTMPSTVYVGFAANCGDFVTTTLTQATFDNLSITSGSLPSGWADQDIGQVATAGSATYNSGTYTVQGIGALYGYADKLNYAYTSRTGDFTVIARVASLNASATQSLAGVMIRGSLAVDGKYALVGKRADNNITAMMWRADNGDTYGASGNTWAGIPQWVKLVRQDNVYTGYGSTDGQTYVQVGSVTLTTMPSMVYVGFAINCGDFVTTALTQATFDNLSIVP